MPMRNVLHRLEISLQPRSVMALAVGWILLAATVAGAVEPRPAAPRPEPTRGPNVRWTPQPDQPPVLFLTGENLQRLRRNIEREADPWQSAWQRVLKRADEGITTEPQPYVGDSFRELTGQAQAQSKLIRAMALRWRVTGEEPYADKAREMLLAWATSDPFVGSTPPVTTTGDAGQPWGNEPDVGLLLAVAAVGMADAYTCLYPHLDPQETGAVDRWLRYLAGRIQEGREAWIKRDYYGRQHYNNHLSLQNMAVAAIGFATRDPALVQWVFDSGEGDYFDMLTGAILMPSEPPTQVYRGDKNKRVRPGEIYDRYRIATVRNGKGQGINYSFLQLRGLTLATEMAHNNGLSFYDYIGPNSESLELAYEQLAPYLITFDSAHYGDYHAGDAIGRFQSDMYEIIYRRLVTGENGVFAEVLRHADRVQDMPYVLGHSAVLLYGEPLAPGNQQGRSPHEVLEWRLVRDPPWPPRQPHRPPAVGVAISYAPASTATRDSDDERLAVFGGEGKGVSC